jgi:predicted Holliday junction resolvase-like endonuclease
MIIILIAICIVLLAVCMGQRFTINELKTKIDHHEHSIANLNTWVGQEIHDRQKKRDAITFEIGQN